MNQSDFYLSIFIEHIGSASIVPFVSSLTLEAMRYFGGYALKDAALVGLSGLVVGCMLGWGLGYAIAALRNNVSFLGSDQFIGAQTFFHKYGFVAAAFFWFPLGSIIMVLLGFFRTPIWKTLLCVTIGACIYLRKYLLA